MGDTYLELDHRFSSSQQWAQAYHTKIINAILYFNKPSPLLNIKVRSGISTTFRIIFTHLNQFTVKVHFNYDLKFVFLRKIMDYENMNLNNIASFIL